MLTSSELLYLEFLIKNFLQGPNSTCHKQTAQKLHLKVIRLLNLCITRFPSNDLVTNTVV